MKTMAEKDRQGVQAGRWVIGSIAVALIGSLWAWADLCTSCRAAQDLSGGSGLAPLGVFYYSILLVAGLLGGSSRFLFFGVSLASGAHFILVGLLAKSGIFCAPCVLTAGAVWSALAGSFILDPVNLKRASVAMPLAGFITLASLHVLAATERAVVRDRLAPIVAESAQGTQGRVTLTAFVRSGCHWCDVLERDVLPRLRAEFPDLYVRVKRAPEGIPTPTIIVNGEHKSVFPGLPETVELAGAIRLAGGAPR